MRSLGRVLGPSAEVEVVSRPSAQQLARRLPQLLIGLAMVGAGIAMLVRARLGLSPWDVLHQGISRVTGIDFGTVVILVGAVALLAWVPLRQRPGVGTILNTALVGLVADGVLALMPSPGAMVLRVLLLVTGLMAAGLGTGLYIGAGMGPGPRDGLMTGIAARGVQVWVARTSLEASALVGGWLLGGNVGIGTALFALTIGPMAHVSIRRFNLGPESRASGLGLAGD